MEVGLSKILSLPTTLRRGSGFFNKENAEKKWDAVFGRAITGG